MDNTGAILAFDNRFHATADKRVQFSGTGWDANQPLANLGRSQLPIFAQFTGPDADLTLAAVDAADAPQPFTADVLAILGHTLPAGTLIQFLDDTTLLGAATWRPLWPGIQHAVIALPEPVSLDTLEIKFSNAGSGKSRVGAVWASPSLGGEADEGWFWDHTELGDTQRARGGTTFSSRGGVAESIPISLSWMGEEEAFGMHLPDGVSLAPPGAWNLDQSGAGTDPPRYEFSAVNGVLLQADGFFSAGEWYELEVVCEYGAGNPGTPAVEIGSGNQFSLQPGRNQIVATPDDGSDLALRLVTADSENFTGAVTWQLIRSVQPPREIHAKRVIEDSATTAPVIWIPRQGQAQIQRMAIYGKLDRPGRVTHASGPWWNATMNIRQEDGKGI